VSMDVTQRMDLEAPLAQLPPPGPRLPPDVGDWLGAGTWRGSALQLTGMDNSSYAGEEA